jgi:hypothetical protein
LSLNGSASYLRNQTDLEILTEGLDESSGNELTFVGALVNGLQFQDRRTTSTNYNVNGSYTEPLSEKWRLQFDGGYSMDEDEGEFIFRLREEVTPNLLNRQFNTLRGGSSLIYRYGEGNNLRIGASFATNQLKLTGDEDRDERFNYLLPSFSYRIRSGKAFYNLYYNANVQAPSISNLQTVARPDATGRVNLGNPELIPAVSHRAGGFFWFNDQFRAISANANVSTGYTDNAFGNSLTFTRGQQIYRTINVSHAWFNQVYVGTTIGMAFMKGELRLNGNWSSSVGQGFVDDLARTNRTSNYSGTIDLTTEFNEQSFLKAGYTYSRNANSFDGEEEVEAIATTTHDIVTQFELEISEKWRFESRLIYRFFEATAFAPVDPIPDLRASFELRPFKTKGHYFVFSAEDLLNQNTIINRSAQQFVTSETISNGLGRYFLATFHYRL